METTMKKHFYYIPFIILFSSLILSACGSSEATNEPTATSTTPENATTILEPSPTIPPATVKIAMFPYGSWLPFLIAQEEGFFAEQGITAEFFPFTTTPDMTAALVQGLIDVGAGPVDVSSLNTIAQGGGIMFVADKGYLDPIGCSTSAWIVRNELMTSGQLDDLSNLAGMKAAFTLATINEYAFDTLVKPFNLSTIR
jgi:ABC-type nitrate/sulfonate/bicarbonate transport system substrate-binding protein